MRAARPTTAGLLAGVVLSGLVATPAADAVTTGQSYWVPVGGRLVVHGHGFGHGHGMSQYGAEGAAQQGLSAKQILSFYYPGTRTGSAGGRIRVLIGGVGPTLTVLPARGLTVRDRGTGTTYPLPSRDGVRRWRLRVAPDHHAVVGFLTTRWHRFHPGGAEELVGDGEFTAAGPLTLVTPWGNRRYRGILRAASPTKDSATRAVVNVLGLDDYVRGVVPREMPTSWAPAAVQAQAVAARTYAAFERAANRHRYYQICDSGACQVYGGVGAEDGNGNAAVRATAGQVLTYHSEPAFTQFAASSGGWTAAGGFPYLPAQADPYDGYAGNPCHTWSTTIDAGRLVRAYPSLGTLRRIEVVSRDGHGQWHGRVSSLVLDGTRSDVTLSGASFAALYGLRSEWFSIGRTPIIARWHRLGGDGSMLGAVRTREYPVRHGSAQRFAHGRIYYSTSTGAHELYGPLLAAYRARGGAGSALGLPTTGVKQTATGQRADFEQGYLTYSSATGSTSAHLD